MEKITSFKDTALQSLSDMWPQFTAIGLKLLGALVLLIVGWLVTKLVVKGVRRLLKLAKANKLDDKLNDIEIVEGKRLSFDTIKIVSKFVKWVMYIIIIIMISDILGLEIISKQISELLSYLPQLFAALTIFILGLLFANFVKKGLKSFFESMDLSGGKIISQVVFFLIFIFISITALNQAGIDTTIITSNITMILAAFLLAFSIAFGIGAKDVVAKLLQTFFARKMFEVGQKIIFNEKHYAVEEVRSISLVLKGENGKLIVPIEDIMENQIKLRD